MREGATVGGGDAVRAVAVTVGEGATLPWGVGVGVGVGLTAAGMASDGPAAGVPVPCADAKPSHASENPTRATPESASLIAEWRSVVKPRRVVMRTSLVLSMARTGHEAPAQYPIRP